jgi:hypothetical protein
MKWMPEHDNRYREMPAAAWAKSRIQYSTSRFEERLRAQMCELAAKETVTYWGRLAACVSCLGEVKKDGHGS